MERDVCVVAEEQIKQGKFENRVYKAKMLLRKRDELKAELRDVDARLQKLSSGEDVELPSNNIPFLTSNNGVGICTGTIRLSS